MLYCSSGVVSLAMFNKHKPKSSYLMTSYLKCCVCRVWLIQNARTAEIITFIYFIVAAIQASQRQKWSDKAETEFSKMI